MGRLDRYIFVTAGIAFVTVLVVLTSMIWLATALRRFDLLTSQGQTVWVFLSVTGLTLPTLMVVTAPIALFLAVSATLYKLNSDSELIVMSAAGVSPWHVFRALLALSVIVALLSTIVVHGHRYVLPRCAGRAPLRPRTARLLLRPCADQRPPDERPALHDPARRPPLAGGAHPARTPARHRTSPHDASLP
jgi:hypothetical protein